MRSCRHTDVHTAPPPWNSLAGYLSTVNVGSLEPMFGALRCRSTVGMCCRYVGYIAMPTLCGCTVAMCWRYACAILELDCWYRYVRYVAMSMLCGCTVGMICTGAVLSVWYVLELYCRYMCWSCTVGMIYAGAVMPLCWRYTGAILLICCRYIGYVTMLILYSCIFAICAGAILALCCRCTVAILELNFHYTAPTLLLNCWYAVDV